MKLNFVRLLILSFSLLAGIAQLAAADATPPAPSSAEKSAAKNSSAPAKAAPAAKSTTEKTSADSPVAPKAAVPAANPPANPVATTPVAENVEQMVRDFDQQRKDLLTKDKALRERLRLAKTEDEKQRIIAELRQLQQQRVEQQREIARQIREDMLNSRRSEAATAIRP